MKVLVTKGPLLVKVFNVMGHWHPLLCRSKDAPLRSGLVFLQNTFSCSVHHTQIERDRCIPLFRSKRPPLHCGLIVLWNTVSFAVHRTQIGLSSGISLFRKSRELTQCGDVIT